jgi:hypothetical protein
MGDISKGVANTLSRPKKYTKKFRLEKNYIFFIKMKRVQATGHEKLSALKRENPALQNREFLHFFYVLGRRLKSVRIRIRNTSFWDERILVGIKNKTRLLAASQNVCEII